MILNVLILFIILKKSRCSMVTDDLSQQTIYVSNYCPTMKYCKEGTHVMCMYYNHERLVGPLCSNYKKVYITPELVEQILHHVNDIRSKLATGRETGKGGLALPRAYGMMRMEWDSELATLAQVLANQCLGLREDECRATDRFPSPSQIVTLINFKVPDWGYISRNTTLRGLNSEKLTFAIDKALNSLHAVRKSVTPSSISECPAFDMVTDMGSRSYMKLIRGKATHIGCGMSAYMRYHATNNAAQNIYNSIQLVCNISDGPQPLQPLYTIEAPIPGTGFSEICGCPPGFKESKRCLCEPDPYYVPPTSRDNMEYGVRGTEIDWSEHRGLKKKETKDVPKVEKDAKKNKADEQCPDDKDEPKLVLLPIFEIQDAPDPKKPKQKMAQRIFHERFGNGSFFRADSIEDPEMSEESYKQHRRSFQGEHKDRKLGRDEYRNEYNSVEDTFTEQNTDSEQNIEFDEKINEIDVYNESDDKFLSILNMLEHAVQNLKMGGKQKKIIEYKMKKIFDTVQNLTPESTEPNSGSGPQILKPISLNKRSDIKNEFLELTNYLKHKTHHKNSYEKEYDNWASSSSSRRGNEIPVVEKDISHDNPDYIDRKDSENYETEHDDRLNENFNKNSHRRNLDHYNVNNKNMDASVYNDHQYDENEEYQPPPPSGNQETIVKYDNKNNIAKAPKRKQFMNIDNYNKNGHYTHNEKETDDEREVNTVYENKGRQNYNKNAEVKPYGRQYSRSQNYARRKQTSHNPVYRRILDNEIKRPMMMTRDHAPRHVNRERPLKSRTTLY